jgi:hypothetical protein
MIGVAKIADSVDGVVQLVAGEVFTGFGERRNEMRVFGARQRDHGVTVRKRSEMLLQFVGRTASRDEMNFVEIETAIGGAGDGKMAVMNRVERATKNGDTAWMVFGGGAAVGLRGGQCCS